MLLVHSDLHLLAQCWTSTQVCTLAISHWFWSCYLPHWLAYLSIFICSFSLHVYIPNATFLFILAWVPVGVYTAACCLFWSLLAWSSYFMHIQTECYLFWSLYARYLYFMYIQLPVVCFDPSMHTSPISCTYNYLLFVSISSPHMLPLLHACTLVSYLPRFLSIYMCGHNYDELMPIYAWRTVSFLLMYVQSSS